MTSKSDSFPKSARLLKKRDFVFSSFKKVRTEDFLLVFSEKGKGRLGVSIPKKVLKGAVQRNRIRRLIREAFRVTRKEFSKVDLHVLGIAPLKESWDRLSRNAVEAQIKKIFS